MRYIESQFKNIIAIQQIGLDSDLNSGVQFSQSQESRGTVGVSRPGPRLILNFEPFF